MASLRVLAFDHEGRPVQFDIWLDDLQLYLLSKDSVSLFDIVSGPATAPPTTADSSTRSQWLTRDAAARLAIRNHLPLAECAHFGQHRTAQALYNAVVASYSSPGTAALGRLLLPYLFPELSAFATVEDMVSHLRASDARYRAAVRDEFLDRNPPPMYITLYFLVTRLPDSLRSVRDQFLSLDPTSHTVDLLAQHLLVAETSAVAVGRRGCAKRRNSKGKGGRGGGGGSGGGGGGSGSGGGGSSGGGGGGGSGGSGGSGGGSGGSGGGGGGSGGSGGSGGGGTGGGGTGSRRVGSGGGQREQQQRQSETLSPQKLREWFRRGSSGGSCPCVIPTGDRAGQTCGRLHTQHRCFSCLDDAWRAEFGDDVELPHWADLPATAPGASESGTLPGSAHAQALHTFTLDSGASRCFFRDSTTLTPLLTPVPVRLADPSGGPVVARSSTVLPCPPVPSGSLSGLHLPSFSTNLVSTAALQDAMVTTTTPGGQCVSICTCTRTERHLATFTRRPGSSQVAASCSYRLLSHQTLLWHHHVGHPSLPHLRGMHSRLLVSSLPRSLPPLPPSPAPPCLPCVEGRQRAAPHSSSFPPTTAPLQTLHMDVWGPSRVSGHSRERYFLLVVDDYTRYTTVFPLRSKGQVVDVLIPWIRTVRLQLREHFGQDLPVLHLHSDKSAQPLAPCLLAGDLAHTALDGEGWRCVVVRDTSADKLSPRAIPCVFLGFVPDAPGWQFYHPTSRCILPSQDVTFDKSVPFYCLFPYRSTPPPPPPLFLAPAPPPIDPLPPQGPAPSGVSQVDPLPGPAHVQVVVGSCATRGAASGGAEPGGAGSKGAESGGGEPVGVGTWGAEPGGAEPEGVEPGGAASQGAESGATEAGGAGGAGARGAGGARVAAGASRARGAAATGHGGARTRGGSGATGAGAGGSGAADPCAGGAGGTVRMRPYFVPLLQQVLGTPSSTDLSPPLLCPPPDPSQPPLQPASPLPAPSPYTEQSGGLTEHREPASRPVSPVRTAHRAPRLRPPPVPGTHAMALRPSSVPLHLPLPAPLESSLPEVPASSTASALVAEMVDFAAACRLDCAIALIAESESASPPSVRGECALGTDVLEDRHEDFESLAAAVPRFASMFLASEGDPDAPDIPTPRSYAEAITGTYVDEVPPPEANIVDGMWIFRVKRSPGSPPAIKARYVARGFSQRQGRRRDYERRGDSGLQLKLLAHGATGATGTRATGATGTLATGATGTRATGVTGSAAKSSGRRATDSRATGAMGSRATGATGSRVTGATFSRATGAAGFSAATPFNLPKLFHPHFTHPLFKP
ncbi:unnamed protein product [Closterium sp. NIES-54]